MKKLIEHLIHDLMAYGAITRHDTDLVGRALEKSFKEGQRSAIKQIAELEGREDEHYLAVVKS